MITFTPTIANEPGGTPPAELIIPGFHSTMRADESAVNLSRRRHFGLNGETEVWGGVDGRNLSIKVVLSKKEWKSYDDILNFIILMESYVSLHGTVQIDADLPATGFYNAANEFRFENVTLIGLRPMPIEGRTDWCIMQDHYGGLFPKDPNDFQQLGGSWFTAFEIVWYQLVSVTKPAEVQP